MMSRYYTETEVQSFLDVPIGSDDIGCFTMFDLACQTRGFSITKYATIDDMPVPGTGNTRSQNIVNLVCSCEVVIDPFSDVICAPCDGISCLEISPTELILPQPGEGNSEIQFIETLKARMFQRDPDLEYMLCHLHP